MNKGIIIGTGGNNPALKKVIHQESSCRIVPIKENVNGSVYRTAISLSGSLYAYATKNGNITVCSNESNQQKAQFLHLGYQVPMVIGLTFVDDNILVSAGSDRNIKFFDIEKGNLIQTIPYNCYSFGLTYIGSNLLAAIQRDEAGDHITLFDAQSYKMLFKSPGFKIPLNYVFAKIDVDGKGQLLAHGDRNGNIYLYDLNQNLQCNTFQTPLGDIQTLCFHDNALYLSGSNQVGIACYDPRTHQQNGSITINEHFISLERMSTEVLIGISDQFSLYTISHAQDNTKIQSIGLVPNFRSASGYSNSFVLGQSDSEKEQKLREIIDKIKQALKDEEYTQAYELVKEIEAMGLKQQALETLAAVERTRGNVLDELEILMILLEESEVCDGNIELFQRLAYVLESVFEYPEAKKVYSKLSKYQPWDEYTSRIEKLQKIIEAGSEEGILFFPNDPEGIFNEVRKSRILHRTFADKVIYKYWELDPVHSLPDDTIFSQIDQKIAKYTGCDNIPLKIIQTVEMIKMCAFDPLNLTLEFENKIKCLVCFAKRVDDYLPYVYAVYNPGDDNQHILNELKKIYEDKTIDDWFTNFISKLEVIMVSYSKEEDDYDGLFD